MEKRKRSAVDYSIAGAGGLTAGAASYLIEPRVARLISREQQIRKDYPNITKEYIANNSPEKVQEMRQWIEEGKKSLRQRLKESNLNASNREYFTAGPKKISEGISMLRNSKNPSIKVRFDLGIPTSVPAPEDIATIRKAGVRNILDGVSRVTAIPSAIAGGAFAADFINRKLKSKNKILK